MELRRPKGDNLEQYSRSLVRECMPTGAGQHKVAKSKLWAVPRARRPVTRHFDLFGPCKGPQQEVIQLGLYLAEEALKNGDQEYAERVLNRVKMIPLEYERERLKKVLRGLV